MIEIDEVGLYVLFEALSIVFCLHYLYGVKICFDWVTICYITVDVVWMSIIQLFQIEHYWSILIYPLIALYCGVKFGYNYKAIIVNNILYIAILSGIQATLAIIFNIILGIERVGELDSIFLNIVVLLLVVVVLRKCKLDKLSKVLQANDKIIMICLIVVIIIVSLFLYNYKKNITFNELYYTLLGISLLLIVAVSIDIGKNKMEAREAEAELRLHRLYESSFRDLIDDICAKQHEFDNHINTIYSQHFICKTYDELVDAQKKYCKEILNENHFNKLLSKGNPVILSFLYSKFLEMEKRGIDVTYKVNIEELDCNVPVYKMVEIMGNLINNAIDAVEINHKKKIYIMMVEEKDKICIEVSNQNELVDCKKINDFFKKGYSEKGKNRGYGLYNVRKICEEYGIAILHDNIVLEGENCLVFRLLINKPL